MAFFNLFKKKKVKEISLEEAIKKLSYEKKRNNGDLLRISSQIDEIIKRFAKGLKEISRNLKGIDLSNRKEETRLKEITMQGIRDYSSEMERLSRKFGDEFFSLNLEAKLNFIYFEIDSFARKSHKKFHMGTVLVGKEMEEARNFVLDVLKEISRIKKENIESFNASVKLREIDKKATEEHDLEREQKDIAKRINEKTAQIEKCRKEKEILEKNIEFYLKSKERKEFVESKEKVKEIGQKIKREISDIKSKINFKELSKKYHGAKKIWDLIKSYRENFEESLRKDSSLKLGEVLSDDISKQLLSIRKNILELEALKENVSEDKKLYALEKEAEIKLAEYKSLKEDLRALEKINEKIKENKKEAKNKKIKQIEDFLKIKIKD